MASSAPAGADVQGLAREPARGRRPRATGGRRPHADRGRDRRGPPRPTRPLRSAATPTAARGGLRRVRRRRSERPSRASYGSCPGVISPGRRTRLAYPYPSVERSGGATVHHRASTRRPLPAGLRRPPRASCSRSPTPRTRIPSTTWTSRARLPPVTACRSTSSGSSPRSAATSRRTRSSRSPATPTGCRSPRSSRCPSSGCSVRPPSRPRCRSRSAAPWRRRSPGASPARPAPARELPSGAGILAAVPALALPFVAQPDNFGLYEPLVAGALLDDGARAEGPRRERTRAPACWWVSPRSPGTTGPRRRGRRPRLRLGPLAEPPQPRPAPAGHPALGRRRLCRAVPRRRRAVARPAGGGLRSRSARPRHPARCCSSATSASGTASPRPPRLDHLLGQGLGPLLASRVPRPGLPRSPSSRSWSAASSSCRSCSSAAGRAGDGRRLRAVPGVRRASCSRSPRSSRPSTCRAARSSIRRSRWRRTPTSWRSRGSRSRSAWVAARRPWNAERATRLFTGAAIAFVVRCRRRGVARDRGRVGAPTATAFRAVGAALDAAGAPTTDRVMSIDAAGHALLDRPRRRGARQRSARHGRSGRPCLRHPLARPPARRQRGVDGTRARRPGPPGVAGCPDPDPGPGRPTGTWPCCRSARARPIRGAPDEPARGVAERGRRLRRRAHGSRLGRRPDPVPDPGGRHLLLGRCPQPRRGARPDERRDLELRHARPRRERRTEPRVPAAGIRGLAAAGRACSPPCRWRSSGRATGRASSSRSSAGRSSRCSPGGWPRTSPPSAASAPSGRARWRSAPGSSRPCGCRSCFPVRCSNSTAPFGAAALAACVVMARLVRRLPDGPLDRRVIGLGAAHRDRLPGAQRGGLDRPHLARCWRSRPGGRGAGAGSRGSSRRPGSWRSPC